LLSYARNLTGKSAAKYVNDIVRICVDNVCFDKEHDDICYENYTFKLVKEMKTTGLIDFKSAMVYKHFDHSEYTTKNYDKGTDTDDEHEYDYTLEDQLF
jgi:actin-related protein